MASLKVFLGKKHIANLLVNSDLEYEFRYVDGYDGFSISPHISTTSLATSSSIKNFLQNILPEGRVLDDIVNFTHISKDNLFALIKELGFESSGALSFTSDDLRDKALFREIKTSELIERIDTIEQKSIAIWDKKPRLSLAGVQDKLAVIIQNDKIGLANGTLSSTHILKFQTLRYNHIVLNEFYCMSLARQCGIDTANCHIERFQEHLVLNVERFDRVIRKEHIERLHIIDACQLLDVSPLYKYERAFGKGRDVADIRNGVSFDKLFKATQDLKVPAVAKLKILDWALFNLIIGNSDAHGKNISFFIDNRGIEVAPFYDILSTIVYTDIEHDLAMAFGDEFDIDDVLGYDLVEFANSIGLPKQLVSVRVDLIAKSILKHIETIPIELINQNEVVFIKHLKELISQRAKRYLDISKEMLKINT